MIQQFLFRVSTLKKLKTFIHNNICTPMFIAALFIAKTWKQHKCSLIDVG